MQIVELYPQSGRERSLVGTYLSEGLHQLGTPETPFVYANFVSSIDGRIAVVEAHTNESYTLDELASGHDWRLFQELQAHATCLVTHGGYLRALAEQKFGDILQVGISKEAQDIGEWRHANGLTRQPAVAVVSTTLDFPLPESLQAHGQPVHILTTSAAPAERVRAWERRGYPVVVTGDGDVVKGEAMVRAVGALGYERLYLLTGPKMLETVIRDGVLSRLYLTMTHQVVGGEAFHTLVSGPALGDAGRMRLRSLFYDKEAPKGTGQWFAAFDLGVESHGGRR